MNELVKPEGGEIAQYNPDQGLKSIAVAEAAERHFRRAKDATHLREAIERKLKAQAEYVVWRDKYVVPSRDRGKQRKRDGVSELQPHNLPDADPGKVTIHRWRNRLCTKGRVDGSKIQRAVAVALDKIAVILSDVTHRTARMCEQENANTIRGTEGTGEFERYTPAYYIEAARRVLGAIDLDPASSEQAQQTVRAANFFTAETNGLMHHWHGRVWLNPPYHRELARVFIDRLIVQLKLGHVSAAILLTNNSTDTGWFDTASRMCASVCFTHGRIRFTQPNGDRVLPTQGQAFFYFGDDLNRFEDEFGTIGSCFRLSRPFYGLGSDLVDGGPELQS